jgi:large subunit ribosomal protein L15
MQLHNIKREHPNKKARQVGRGGSRGKTSGRGGKGQTARAGNKPRPQLRDIIKKLPKLRGRGKNSLKSVSQPVQTVTLTKIEKLSVDTINRDTLLKAGLIKRESGVLPQVKIVGNTKVTKKFVIAKGIKLSAGAKSIIEGAGGTIK